MTGQRTLADLWDLEEIKRVQARYCRFVDFRDWAGLRDLLTDDAVFHFPDGVVLHGADAFIERLENLNAAAEVRSVHHCHTPDIELGEDGTASAYWALFDYADKVWAADGRRESHQAYSYYCMGYRRDRDGRWRIAHWRLHRIRVDVLAGEPFAFPDAAPPPPGPQAGVARGAGR